MSVKCVLSSPGHGLHTRRKASAWHPRPDPPLLPQPGCPAPPHHEILWESAERPGQVSAWNHSLCPVLRLSCSALWITSGVSEFSVARKSWESSETSDSESGLWPWSISLGVYNQPSIFDWDRCASSLCGDSKTPTAMKGRVRCTWGSSTCCLLQSTHNFWEEVNKHALAHITSPPLKH